MQPSMQPCPSQPMPQPMQQLMPQPMPQPIPQPMPQSGAPQFALFPPNPFVNGLESQEPMGGAVTGTCMLESQEQMGGAVAEPRESQSQPPPQAMHQGGATTLAPLRSSCSERVDAVFTAAYAVAGAANAIAAARQYSKPFGTSAPTAPTAPAAPAAPAQAAARYR